MQKKRENKSLEKFIEEDLYYSTAPHYTELINIINNYLKTAFNILINFASDDYKNLG